MLFFLLWIKRFFLSRQHFVRWTHLVSLFSLLLAVSTLTLSLSVYSGYENTVRQAVLDITGHLIITAPKPVSEKSLLKKINLAQTTHKNSIKTISPFISVPVLALKDGKLAGALLESLSYGLPTSHPQPAKQNQGTKDKTPQTPQKNNLVLNLHHRIKAGTFNLQDEKLAILGQGLAKKLKLKVGDTFHTVAPKVNAKGVFQKTYQELKVTGIVDMGFHDFNSRYIIRRVGINKGLGWNLPKSHDQRTDPQTVTRFAGRQISIKKGFLVSGARLLLKNPQDTKIIRSQLKKALGPSYKVEDWEDILKNRHAHYFHAVQKEKLLIFFILMVLVLAGAFNVSSHLTISILNQAHSLSILKAMGAKNSFIFSLLLTQGFVISFIGTVGGVVLGWGLSSFFVFLQSIWPLIPSEIYKVSYITTTLKINDIAMIMFCSQAVCLVSCLLPALRALKMSIRENLLAN